MFNFTITTAELIGWIIIYIVGLICVALGLGCVIHGERQKRFQLQQQLDNLHDEIRTLDQRILDLESHAIWSVLPKVEFQFQNHADYIADDGTPVIDGKPIADATPGTVTVAGEQAYVYNGTSWGTIDSLGWDKIAAAGTSCQPSSPTNDGNVTKVITPSENDPS